MTSEKRHEFMLMEEGRGKFREVDICIYYQAVGLAFRGSKKSQ